MGISANLCGDIRERLEDRPPRKWASLSHDFRMQLNPHGTGVIVFKTDRPDATALIGYAGRDGGGPKWYLRPGWRDEVRQLVATLGIKDEESEEVLW